MPIRAPCFFSAVNVDNVSGKRRVFTFMCISASCLYSCRKAASCAGSVTPVRMLKDSSSVLPIVRLMASSVTVSYTHLDVYKRQRLEYFEIVDGNTLQKINDWEDTSYAVGCITVFCGEVRLIDNIKYKE